MSLLISLFTYFFYKCRRLAADINIIFGRLAHGAVSATETKTALTEIIIHPEYNATTHDKDIALLKLQTSIVVNNHIQPICLPTTNSQFFTSTLCWATGWGKVNNNGENNDFL